MGTRKYPPLKRSEVIAILVALGFVRVRHGNHEVYEREADDKMSRKVVPVGSYDEFDETLIKRMIPQTGYDRVKFYKATPGTAKKI